MAKFRFVAWLLVWLQSRPDFEFDWDDGNWTKSVIKHNVRHEETEGVFTSGRAMPLGIQISPVVLEERFGIVGATSSGRVLHIVFTLRNNKIRPISTRPAQRKERGIYEAYLLREV